MENQEKLQLILEEGEGLKVEFKEKLSNLDREIVAMANTMGGSIYIGINDDGEISGIKITNSLKSQIQDIARNCDPSISIELISHVKEKILELRIAEGSDKPYRCKDGFFLRNGPNSQKLKRDEVVKLINDSGKIYFDEVLNKTFEYPNDFSNDAFAEYLKLSGIETNLPIDDILLSLNVAEEVNEKFYMNNTGVLFFSKNPQQYFPESYITAVKYKSHDRFSIIDKKDFKGNLISQIENTLSFIIRHMSVEARVEEKRAGNLGPHRELSDYPILALREAVINAVTHRDYSYESSHIYVHMYTNHIEIENPGGLFHGLTIDNLGKRSVRRNRLIADLLHRTGYIERVGSGFDRMRKALIDNSNPELEVSATNFFNIRFYKRAEKEEVLSLTSRQRLIYNYINEHNEVNKREVALLLNVSDDTTRREINRLIELGLIKIVGRGKATTYRLV